MHRSTDKAERPSFGMGVVAVAVGVGYGVVDTITRHAHAHAHDHPMDQASVIDVRDDLGPDTVERPHAHV
jgi:hypothetical protein